MTKPTFELSFETKLLVRMLTAVPVDGTLTYEAISSELSQPLSSFRGALGAARRIVMRDEGIVFATLRKVGIQRIAGATITNSVAADRGMIRRKATRTLTKLAAVARETLGPADRTRLDAEASLMGVIASVARDSAVTKLESATNAKGDRLPIGRVLDLMK
jgi:hypothetical protein